MCNNAWVLTKESSRQCIFVSFGDVYHRSSRRDAQLCACVCSESVLYVSVSSDVVADNIALEFCSALVGLAQGILLQGGKLVSLLGVKVVKAF